jgi:hypothetical protein
MSGFLVKYSKKDGWGDVMEDNVFVIYMLLCENLGKHSSDDVLVLPDYLYKRVGGAPVPIGDMPATRWQDLVACPQDFYGRIG